MRVAQSGSSLKHQGKIQELRLRLTHTSQPLSALAHLFGMPSPCLHQCFKTKTKTVLFYSCPLSLD